MREPNSNVFTGVEVIVRRQTDALRSVTALRLLFVGLLVLLTGLELSDSGAWFPRTPLWLAPAVVLDGLFALAGFTLARSIDRHGPMVALRRTVWRFGLAIAIVVIVTALVVGPALTERRIGLYYSDPQVWTYLLTIVGYPQASLPGVFAGNNIPDLVNDFSWIIPVSYLSVAVVLLSQRGGRFGSIVIGSIGLFLVGVALFLQSDLLPVRVPFSIVLLFSGRGINGIVAFLGGALVYRERARIPLSVRVAAPMVIGGGVFALLGDPRGLESGLIGPAVALCSAYVSLTAGTLRLPFRHSAHQSEPLLWRTLLVAYPVEQFWMAVGPAQQGWVLNLALSGPVIVLLTGVLWYGLELPILRRFAPDIMADHPFYAAQTQFTTSRGALDPLGAIRAALPNIVAALVIAALALGALAIAMLAMQRDAGGV